MIKISAPAPTQQSENGPIVAVIVGFIVLAALLSCQVLIGGARLLFAFPAYALVALGGVLGLFAIRKVRPSADQICLVSTIVFLGYVLVRASLSPVAYLARFDLYSVAAGLIIYLLTANVVTSRTTRMLILAGLLATALVHVLVGAIQFRNGDNWMPISFLQRFDYSRRASGFYVCPNHLAGLLEVLGVFGLSITLWSRWPVSSKLLVGYATVICYVGVILTGSRGGYLSVLMSLIVFVGFSFRIARAAASTLQIRIAAGTVVVAVLAAFAIFQLIGKSDYLSDRTRPLVDNKNIRLDFWRAALDQWKLNPLIGTGSDTYLFYGRKFRRDAVQMDPVYVHNDYLQLLAEYGVAGMAVFLVFLFVHVRRGLLTARRIGPRRIAVSNRLPSNAMALNVGALAAVAAYGVHSFFDFNLHIPANLLLMAFVFGILANSGVEKNSEETLPNRWKTLLTSALLLALALALGVQTWRLAPGELFAEESRIALRDQRPLAGLSFALKGLQHEQQNPELYFYLGRSRMMSGYLQKDPVGRDSFYRAALTAFDSARHLAPLNETYWLESAFTFDALNRFSEAEWMFDEARELDPKSRTVGQYYEAHLERWRNSNFTTEANPAVTEPSP